MSEGGEEERTVQSNRDTFSQHVAIRAHKNGHLAYRVELEKLLVVLLVVFICVNDIQVETVRFGDS